MLGGTSRRQRAGTRDPYFFPPPFFFAFFAGFDFAHPVTLTGVDSWISAPFWAMNAVGIARDSTTCLVVFLVTFLVLPWTFSFTVFFVVTDFVGAHRLPFAARAEYLPSGSVISKLVTGWSGTVWKVLEVIPALLMNVEATRLIVKP